MKIPITSEWIPIELDPFRRESVSIAAPGRRREVPSWISVWLSSCGTELVTSKEEGWEWWRRPVPEWLSFALPNRRDPGRTWDSINWETWADWEVGSHPAPAEFLVAGFTA